MDKKNRLMTEMDSAQAQLRDLGSLPQAFDKCVPKNLTLNSKPETRCPNNEPNALKPKLSSPNPKT